MIKPTWKRIAGAHFHDGADVTIAWMAWDTNADAIHVYDCHTFRKEVPAVIMEGINARGRWIPIAWTDKDFAASFLQRGANMNHEPAEDTEGLAELLIRDMWERMRTGRFFVERRLGKLGEEIKTMRREKGKIPKDSHPGLTAIRHALAQLDYARAQESMGGNKIKYPKAAIV